ncbi:carotenoid 9,10(9',10')-cleavage dioxygenase 1-like [Lolium rigidum]|uniref:carotenoid 9,10(9',10')-cleavage dioxygenase 1-like n=1 Tax=Lolium rigidum TaxID=89674 RepID=UPI001F5D0BFC|nr:carotenoid 9,10(9',10')-cleavage dioxygenase 1-like [Lolium rigidum]
MATTFHCSLRLSLCSGRRRPSSISISATRLSHKIISTAKPYFKELQQQFALRTGAVNSISKRLLGAFVESTFTLSHQPLRPTEGNFAPVKEIGEIQEILDIAGNIPADFPEGVYIRNGSNPLFGALHSSKSIFGKSHDIWVEGEGMLHGLYFTKSSDNTWTISYTNRYVQSDTYRLEKELKKPCFIPSTDGDLPAVLIAAALNILMYGKAFKNISNTSVFEHAGRVFSAAENDNPHEIDLYSLGTLGSWNVDGEWKMPFTAHPKVIPGTGELVIFGFNLDRPFLTVGIVSADGKKLKRKVDIELDRCTYCHELGVTATYNIILDTPLTLSKGRMLRGAPLIEFEKDSYARIGVMPHYGDASSIIWFYVQPFCTIHLVNCFEEDDEVIVRGFHVPSSIIMGPRLIDMTKETSKEYSRLYEWRLNLKTRKVTGKYLTGMEVALEFPVINNKYVGLCHKYAYAQVADSPASFAGGPGIVRPKFGGFAKILLDEKEDVTTKDTGREGLIKVEYHHLDRNQFCTGATFVPKVSGANEDDGWIVSFVHDEGTHKSEVHLIDTRRFGCGPIAKITLPQRVPYGFHGAFVSKST